MRYKPKAPTKDAFRRITYGHAYHCFCGIIHNSTAKVHKRAPSSRQHSVSQTALRSCRLFPAVSTQYRTGGSSHAI